MAKEEWYDKLACALVFIGALEVGLIGVMYNWSLLQNVLGNLPQVLRVVQVLIGISAVYLAYDKYLSK